ncbi:MAG: prolyl oligopeptidase family serine peptidase, partial [Armatimonadetes bacterium]|nr:prolyl oligopeptidase family serine peptidase [Armatimonadota bacterium]
MGRPALRICCALRLATMLALILSASACLSAAAAQSDASSEDLMRQPWARDGASFITEWLVCGEFPNLPAGPTQDSPAAPRVGLETDFLEQHSGEADIRPTPGMTHARPDGTTAEWTSYTSPGNSIDFTKAFPNRPTEWTVGYAYATITPEHPGPAALAVGSDDGVRVWLNGRLVHDHAVRRALRPDEDLIPITLDAGENRILIKVEQGTGGWEVCLRVLHPSQVQAVFSRMLTPAIMSDEPGRLVVAANQPLAGLAGSGQVVTVEVVAAGGRIAAAKMVPKGDRVRFDPSLWPGGSYEIICTMAAPDGRLLVRRLPWYKGDAAAAARAVVASAARADATTVVGAHHAMLAEMLLLNAGGNLDQVPAAQLPRLYGPLMEFEELLLEQAGKTGGLRSRGFVRLAHFDDVDDSPQFCRAYLPAGYTPDRTWPLIVNLHGYYAENPPSVGWWDMVRRYDAAADLGTAIVIHPMGRYNTSYRGIGDADVLRCIELAKSRFAVDEDRVYLTGYSMGGGGTWHVGTRHADLFAALGPYYGGWDYHVWLDREHIAGMTARERFLAEVESSFAQADQLLNVPLWVMHGDADTLVEPAQSRYAVRLLQRWGYDIRYQEVPGRGHEALGTEDSLYAWFLEHERNPHPRRVRVRSADLEGAAAYWVRIGQREDPFAFINADAEVVGPNTIRLDTDNALEVTLSPGGPLVDRAQPLHVIWNGSDVR